MPMQQKSASFAARVAAANTQYKGKPLDLGRRRLPGGIKNGVAKLQIMTIKVSESDDGGTPKGERYVYADAVVVSPAEYKNFHTTKFMPLCDTPARGNMREVSLEENWNLFRSLMFALGISEPSGPQYDIRSDMSEDQLNKIGESVLAYYNSAMVALTNPQNKPVYISFSTRDYKSKRRIGESQEAFDNRAPTVIEEWNGPAKPEVVAAVQKGHDPAASVREGPPTSPPPSGNGAALPQDQEAEEPFSEMDQDEEVAALVAALDEDPLQETDEGKKAANRLKKLACNAGWTEEAVEQSQTWADVGKMALESPEGGSGPEVGSRHKYASRNKAGDRVKDKKGRELPPVEVEVTSVDDDNQTCTVKTVKDGKDVVDVRSKEPVAVKWDWLE